MTIYRRGGSPQHPVVARTRPVSQAIKRNRSANRLIYPHLAAPIVTAGNAFAAPPAAAISGMSSTPVADWDWTGGSPLADWFLYDGSGNANGERSQPKAANAIVTTDAACSGGKYLALMVRRETYFGLPLSGVQMEASGFVFGNGSPFYVEVRLRWTGYLGFWGGPWMFQFPGTAHEVDIMETVNSNGPWTTLHTPDHSTQVYNATNDGDWHRYGIRFDASAVNWFFETTPRSGVMTNVLTYSSPTDASAFKNATMFPKMQHLCGGTFPESDNGGAIADGSLPTSDKFFDCDYYRVYQ